MATPTEGVPPIYTRDYRQLPTHQVGELCHVARSAPKTALDIGCGTGQLARDLYHRGYQVTGIDISTEAISQAQASTIYTQGITFAVRDITKPPLPPCHYGLITCKYVVAFIADRAAFFRAIGTLLEPTGVVAIITPNPARVPAHKAHIAVPATQLNGELAACFWHVEHRRYGRDDWFICRAPRTGR